MTHSFKHRGTLHSAEDLQSLSNLFSVLRDTSGEGMSTWPDGEMIGGGHISYNGRIWASDGSLRLCPSNPGANDPDAVLIKAIAADVERI